MFTLNDLKQTKQTQVYQEFFAEDEEKAKLNTLSNMISNPMALV